jgi:putative tryptophan/tyrosine transport system substrate-binding protein
VTRLSRRNLLRTSAQLVGLSTSVMGLAAMGGCQFVNPLATTTARAHRIGYIYPGSRTAHQLSAAAFLDGMRQLGWVEGENLAIEWRFGDGRNELLPDMAAELADLPVELIFSAAAAPYVVGPRTSGVPIVADFMVDPPAYGIQNLARPGANVTGLTTGDATAQTKSVELLKTILPQLDRLAIMADRSAPQFATRLAPAAKTAVALGIRVMTLGVGSVEDVGPAFATALAWRAEALQLISQPSFTAGVIAGIVDLAAENRLPTMYGFGPSVTDNGALMAYSPNIPAQYRQGAEYVDKILRGARPADLPVEEPREFEFIVNLRVAQALGISLPPDAAAQVSQWVA